MIRSFKTNTLLRSRDASSRRPRVELDRSTLASSGAFLNIEGRYKVAEALYLRDLEVFPANGWALLGLRDSLVGQGRDFEAAHADKAFRRAWRSADVMPPASCSGGEPVIASE